ncbi:MAG TPA: DinB family protein [Ignavibacteria bacterium]|jgi:uncharacterized damage-inducible protein DinB
MGTKNSSIAPVIEQFKMQTRLFNNVLQDFEKDYDKRPNEKTNHAAWLAGHVLYARLNIANMIGVNEPNPYSNLYDNFKGLDEKAKYPSLAEVKKNWNDLTAKFTDKLESIPDEQLNSPAPFPLPIADSSLKGMIAFFAHHEAYHIGQLSYARKYLGYEPMKY